MKVTTTVYVPSKGESYSRDFMLLATINILAEFRMSPNSHAVGMVCSVALVDRDGKKIGDVVDEHWVFNNRRDHQEKVAADIEVNISSADEG